MSQSIGEMAIEILRGTHDGDALAPEHLYLVQCAVNGNLSEFGEVEYYKLHRQVSGGNYQKPWLHGIEYLTKNHAGFVFWKGQEVEHYSFLSYEDEAKAAEELAARCRHLEAIGVPVNTGNAVWRWEKHAAVQA